MRKARGLSQEKLAELAGICVTWMRKIEHDCANLTWDVIDRLAKALDVPVWMIYGLQLEPNAVWDELTQVQVLLRPAGEAVLV